MNTDKISIVVPAYNIEEYIANTVKSICNQTYKNLEIIIVDDGSNDNTSKILDNLSKCDNRIKIIHKENGGVTSARLEGIKVATGDWIGFVDGDDFIEPNMYEILLKNACKYEAEISHCGYRMVFPSRVDYYYNTGKIVEQDNFIGLKDLLSGEFVEPGIWNKLYKRYLFNDMLNNNLIDINIKINEDLLMNYYLFKESSKSVYSDFCPYYYMLRKGSAATSSINENKLRDPLLVQKIIYDDLKDNKVLSRIVTERIIMVLISNSILSYGNQKKLIKPYRKKARKELREMLPNILNNNFNIKYKFFSLWVSIWPASYRWVHKIYAVINGTNNKYEVK